MSEGQDTTAEVNERELAMVELLYGERDDASMELGAAEREELAELREMRGLFSQLEDEEPPSRLTAQLMAAASTEHEAARRVSAAHQAESDPGEGGFWKWLMRPFLANPAFAAAASLVVIVGVAGALYVVGGLEKQEQAAQPTLAPASEGEATSPGARAPAPAADTAAAKDQAAAGADYDLDELANGYGDTGGAEDEKPAEVSKEAARPRAKGNASETKRKEPSRPDRAKADGRSAGKRARRTGRALKSVDDGIRVGGDRAPSDSEAGGSGDAPQTSSPTPADRAAKLHAEARRRARTGECAKALKLAGEIRAVSRSYYDAKVARDSQLRACRRSKVPQAGSKNKSGDTRPSSL